MIDAILYGISINGTYDLIKNKLINKINSRDFSMVFNDTFKRDSRQI